MHATSAQAGEGAHREVFTPEADVVERVAELDLVAFSIQPQPHHHVRVAAVQAADLVRALRTQLTNLDGVGGVGEFGGFPLLLAAPPAPPLQLELLLQGRQESLKIHVS